MIDNLQSTTLGKDKDYVLTGGSTADRARLEEACRSNTRPPRTPAENLISVRRAQNVDLNQIAQDTRDRIVQDLLNKPGP